jgi:hypothetical protein
MKRQLSLLQQALRSRLTHSQIEGDILDPNPTKKRKTGKGPLP